MSKVTFNKPHTTGKELEFISQAIASGHISGNGSFTQKCDEQFKERFGFKKTLLTTSCTDALEMTALLMGIGEGDEIIMPSYTFVSTALAFVRSGAKIVFCDSHADQPNMDENALESLVSSRTKAIVVVHYAGVAVDMDMVLSIANQHDLYVVEDAAQSIDSYYKDKPLGGIGHFGCFSFHETKNIQSGEGGLLVINDERFFERSEIIWEKGTNRAKFFRGEIAKYGWVDVGSSFLQSDILAAFLYAQLLELEAIQAKRKEIWEVYFHRLSEELPEGVIDLPVIPDYATNNGHMFYLVCKSVEERTALIKQLKSENISSVFHYQSLHKSEFYKEKAASVNLPNCDRYSDCLLRLPLHLDLSRENQDRVINCITKFYSE